MKLLVLGLVLCLSNTANYVFEGNKSLRQQLAKKIRDEVNQKLNQQFRGMDQIFGTKQKISGSQYKSSDSTESRAGRSNAPYDWNWYSSSQRENMMRVLGANGGTGSSSADSGQIRTSTPISSVQPVTNSYSTQYQNNQNIYGTFSAGYNPSQTLTVSTTNTSPISLEAIAALTPSYAQPSSYQSFSIPQASYSQTSYPIIQSTSTTSSTPFALSNNDLLSVKPLELLTIPSLPFAAASSYASSHTSTGF